MLEAIKGTDFTSEEWLDAWREFWEEERKVHCKAEKGKGKKTATEEEVMVGSLWDEDDMDGIDDEQWENGEIKGFKLTKLTEV